MKAQIYRQLGKNQEALTSIKACLDTHGNFDQGWLVRAILEEQLGQLENAIHGYTTFLELTNNGDPQITQHLLQLALKQKMMQQNKKETVVDISCFKKALCLFEQKQYKQALWYIDKCLMEKPDNIKSQLLKIQILNAMHQFNHAAAVLHAWIDKDPGTQLWAQTLHLLAHNGAQLSTVVKTFQTIIDRHPDNKWASLYLADLQIRTGATQEAIKTLEHALPHVKDPLLQTKLFFQLGILYFEQKKYAEMYAALERGKALKTNFPPLLNLLAHYQATKGNNIAQAQKLIEHARRLDTHNPHFLDTHALILYKQKQYHEARALFERLHTQLPEDATILLHLAKTESKLGNTDKACAAVKTAKKLVKTTYEKEKISKLRRQLGIS